jgi:hypothetical protein
MRRRENQLFAAFLLQKIMTDSIHWEVEYTDTFGGQANYCWVERAEFELSSNSSNRQIVTKAKGELGLTGVRCKTSSFGEGFELRPVNSCTVVFVTPRY